VKKKLVLKKNELEKLNFIRKNIQKNHVQGKIMEFENPKEMDKSKASYEKRAEQFQMGHNPMKMSEMEEDLARGEVAERRRAHVKYINGIQGVDGGHCC
jgi:hypothetical protein